MTDDSDLEEWMEAPGGGFVLVCHIEKRYEKTLKRLITRSELSKLYGDATDVYWQNATRVLLNPPLQFQVIGTYKAVHLDVPTKVCCGNYHLGFVMTR